jgi:hypothetical protein
MSASVQETDLHESLGTLENALLTPPIAGELLDWVETVRQAASSLQPQLESYIRDVLHAQYREIAKTDTEMLAKVEQAIGEDQKLLDDFVPFRGKLDELTTQAPAAQKDELRVQDLRRRVEESGTQFVLAVRKHLLAVNAWLSESIYRDRGSVD